MIIPMRSKGMPQWTLCVRCWDAERPGLHSHAERGNDRLQPIPTRENQRCFNRSITTASSKIEPRITY